VGAIDPEVQRRAQTMLRRWVRRMRETSSSDRGAAAAASSPSLFEQLDPAARTIVLQVEREQRAEKDGAKNGSQGSGMRKQQSAPQTRTPASKEHSQAAAQSS